MNNKNIKMLLSLSVNIIIIVFGIYVVFAVGSKAYTVGNKIFNEVSIDSQENAREVEVTLTENMSAKNIADLLFEKGLVNDKTIAFYQIRLSDFYNKIPAGTYILNTAMKPTEMLETMFNANQVTD